MQLLKAKTLPVTQDKLMDILHDESQATEKLTFNLADISFVEDEDNDRILLRTCNKYGNVKEAALVRDTTIPQVLDRLDFTPGKAVQNFLAFPYTSTQVTFLNDLVRRKLHNKPSYRLYIPFSNYGTDFPTVRAILSSGYQDIPSYQLIKALDTYIEDEQPQMEFIDAFYHPTLVQLRYTDPKISKEIDLKGQIKQFGDTIAAGCHVQNSETGHGSARIKATYYQAKCKNMAYFGFEDTDITNKVVHWGKKNTYTRAKDVFKNYIEELPDIFANFAGLIDIANELELPCAYTTGNTTRIWTNNPAANFNYLLEEILSENDVEYIASAFYLDRIPSVWGMLNAMNDNNAISNLPIAKRFLLQEAVGKFLEELSNFKIINYDQVKTKVFEHPRNSKLKISPIQRKTDLNIFSPADTEGDGI